MTEALIYALFVLALVASDLGFRAIRRRIRLQFGRRLIDNSRSGVWEVQDYLKNEEQRTAYLEAAEAEGYGKFLMIAKLDVALSRTRD